MGMTPGRHWGYMPTLTVRRAFHAAPATLALFGSAMVHALAVLALVDVATGGALSEDLSRLAPALYLYAPDRQPGTPREFRVPFPAVLGREFGADEPVMHALPDGVVHARPVPPVGLLPPGPPTLRIDSVFSAMAVDSEVVRYPSAAPIYPDALLKQGLEGAVETEFVVDTTGFVDLTTVRVLASTHEDFTQSVRHALAGARFRPAFRDGQKVRQLVHQRFAFRLYRGPEPTAVPM
jgi:TonB family protein